MKVGIGSLSVGVWECGLLAGAGPRIGPLPSRVGSVYPKLVGPPVGAGAVERVDRYTSQTVWRKEDEALLGRLEDEVVLERLFAYHVGNLGRDALPHPRAAGLIACVRRVPGGAEAVEAALRGEASTIARLLEAPPSREWPAPMIHHLAVYFARIARLLERDAPEASANAWMRALTAWFALGHEDAYLRCLEDAVLAGSSATRVNGKFEAPAPSKIPFHVLADLGERACRSARDLAPAGRAALLALGSAAEASRRSGVSEETSKCVGAEAERHRNAALDAALSIVGDAIDETNARGNGSPKDVLACAQLLLRAAYVWTWSGQHEAAEEFIVERLTTIGWDLYRARAWGELRLALDPFRNVIESMASRVQREPSRVAFAAPVAQMFVFLTDIEDDSKRKLELAERALRICPTHRNGRLNLAAILCDHAMHTMRTMLFFARREDIDRVSQLVERAEALCPTSSELPEAKAMLERVKRGRRLL